MTTLAGSVRTHSVYQLHSESYVMPRALCGVQYRPRRQIMYRVELLRDFYLIAVYAYWVQVTLRSQGPYCNV